VFLLFFFFHLSSDLLKIPPLLPSFRFWSRMPTPLCRLVRAAGARLVGVDELSRRRSDSRAILLCDCGFGFSGTVVTSL
jgi:hypothetical protein